MKITLVSNVGGLNTDIVPHFFDHYAKLGVDNFVILFHIHSENTDFSKTIKDLTEKYNISYAIWEGKWSKEEKERRLNDLVGEVSKDDWNIYVNQNEFIQFGENVYDFFSKLKSVSALIGKIIDRFNPEFPSIDENSNLEELFTQEANITKNIENDNLEKIVARKGNDLLCSVRDNLIVPIYYYNWDFSVFKRMIEKCKSGSEFPNFDKARALKFLTVYFPTSNICDGPKIGKCKVCLRAESMLIKKKYDENYTQTKYPHLENKEIKNTREC